MTESAFPKRVKIYLHGDKDSNWQTGQEIGLSESAIKEKFAYALLEVEFEVDVSENGSTKVATVDGHTLSEDGGGMNIDRFRAIQLEQQLREAQMAVSRHQCFMRDITVYLEEGCRDGVDLADDIHEALGEGRPNKTKPEGEEEDDDD